VEGSSTASGEERVHWTANAPASGLLENMGVNHRRFHVGVAQQLLDRADVVAVLEKVRGEGMAFMPRAA
jgi:hypothetical protein